MNIFIELFFIFLLALLFIKLIRDNASRFNFIDIPNDRSIHIYQTPRAAGIGFYLAILSSILIFHLEFISSYAWTFIAISIVFIVGVWDDYHETSPNIKYIVIIIATGLLSFDNIIIENLGTYFGIEFLLGWLGLPFTIFAVVGFTNALNLIDGLDGLSATVSIVILASFLYIGYIYNDMFMLWISAAFIATLLAFLVFNWHPASIFMGDSGSLTVGFVIAILATKSLAYIPAVSIFYITAIPVLDTLVVMIRRKVNGRPVSTADTCHMHHIFKGFFSNNTKKTVLFLGTLQIIYSLIGLQLDEEINEGFLFIIFIINIIVLYSLLSFVAKKQKLDC